MDIPGFEIKRTIGRGGMATVYLAVQKSLGREVVLKTLNTSHDETGDFVDRFMNEGRIIASLRHPHIITVYDIGTEGDIVYIAMEYIDGGDLKTKIENRIAPVRALDLLTKIGQALEYAHKRDIVHRDVKPANILFRSDGTPVLSDFGIAKQVALDSELTSTGTILGSPFYMSPEQAEGLAVDGRTDIYSLGVIFYEMLTGKKPYEGDSAIKVIMQHIQSPVPTLPPELQQYQPLLSRMMAKNRDERIPDAAHLLEEIDEVRQTLAGKTGRSATLHTLKLPFSPATTRRSRGTTSTLGSPAARVALLGGFVLVALAGSGAFIYKQISKPPTLVAGSRPPPQIDTGSTGPTQTTTFSAGRAPANGDGGEVSRRDAARALEWLARNSLREDRLMQPPADNAHYYYSRLLELDPHNAAARRGFKEIAERFVVLAEKEYANGNYAKAQAYITLGLQVDPDNDGLATLQALLESRERTLLETVMEFFKANG